MYNANILDQDDLLLIDGNTVSGLLKEQEIAIIQEVRNAYELHEQRMSVLPHSVFLTFPEKPRDRIIGLPAYLGGGYDTAGIKWVSSFPENVEKGIERASAVLILNSMVTGRPTAMMDCSVINAKRTAASAALATLLLAPKGFTELGLVGCGPIGFEIVKFIAATTPSLTHLVIHDISESKARKFSAQCSIAFKNLNITISESLPSLIAQCPVVALSTTAPEPYIHDNVQFTEGALVLNISLRDLAPSLILACDNIVDDIDHVSRERTSIHLTEIATGNRAFIRGTLGELCLGQIAKKDPTKNVTIFSPFGLGVLDLALGSYVLRKAIQRKKGMPVKFFPDSWTHSRDSALEYGTQNETHNIR